jgi:HAD superfamily hydrolase (TIGR01509 family)
MIHGFDARILLFDLDGTLVDSIVPVERQWAVWAARHQLPLDPILKVCHGRPSIETMREVAPHLPNLEAEARDHLKREEQDCEGVVAVPGARELLASLPASSWAIVTSCNRALALARLEAAGLPVPPVLVNSDRVSRGKPDPEGYLLGAREMNADPAECLVLEDTPVGIRAGHAAGMRVLAVGTTFGCGAKLKSADACIPDFRETVVDHFHPLTRADWREWLERNYPRPQGIWLVSFKKAAGRPSVTYDEAVEEALCFGWIDSKPNKMDELRTKLWFSPRKKRSVWSKPNKIRIERLQANGLMTPAGQAKIDAAIADGSWTSIDSSEALEVPADLARSLRRNRAANANFQAFPPSVRKGILQWILSAKREETRLARIDQTVRMAAVNLRANFDPAPPATKPATRKA